MRGKANKKGSKLNFYEKNQLIIKSKKHQQTRKFSHNRTLLLCKEKQKNPHIKKTVTIKFLVFVTKRFNRLAKSSLKLCQSIKISKNRLKSLMTYV